jgi:hypothetical protein
MNILELLNIVKKRDWFTRQIGDELKATVGELPAPIVAEGVFSSRYGSSLRGVCG